MWRCTSALAALVRVCSRRAHRSRLRPRPRRRRSRGLHCRCSSSRSPRRCTRSRRSRRRRSRDRPRHSRSRSHRPRHLRSRTCCRSTFRERPLACAPRSSCDRQRCSSRPQHLLRPHTTRRRRTTRTAATRDTRSAHQAHRAAADKSRDSRPQPLNVRVRAARTLLRRRRHRSRPACTNAAQLQHLRAPPWVKTQGPRTRQARWCGGFPWQNRNRTSGAMSRFSK